MADVLAAVICDLSVSLGLASRNGGGCEGIRAKQHAPHEAWESLITEAGIGCVAAAPHPWQSI